MSPEVVKILQLIAYIGMAAGLIGTVLPVIPGPILIWLSTLLWAWADGFRTIGWPTLLLLALMVVVAELSDVALATMGAKKGGAAWSSMIVAGIAAVVGFILFNLIGAILGAFWGLFAWEAYRRKWQWRKAWQASGSFIIGYVAAIIVKMIFAVTMIAIFIWQAF